MADDPNAKAPGRPYITRAQYEELTAKSARHRRERLEDELRIKQRLAIQDQRDTEPRASTSANTSALFPNGIPDRSDIVDLAVRLQTGKGGKLSDNEIARQFTGEMPHHDKKAKSLLASIRRLKRQGRIRI